MMRNVTLIGLVRAFHLYGIVTRSCGRAVRRWAFDQMYRTGKWHFDENHPELISAIEEYSSNGAILILGCGTASIVSYLNQNAFRYLLGIDISPEAISKARRQSTAKVHFKVADILEYQCERNFDVILFSESLYYIRDTEQEELLRRLGRHLTPSGCFIVTLSNPKEYTGIIQMIKAGFQVLRESYFTGVDRLFLIFR
jgi:SAM-dependent methyltransferase